MATKNLYISSLEPNSGLLIVTMGLIELLKSKVDKIAIFRPIIKDKTNQDYNIDFLIKYFNLEQRLEQSYGFTIDEAEDLISENKTPQLIESLLQKYHTLEREYDFVVIQGIDLDAFSKTLPQNLNHIIATNLQSPYISVINAHNKNAHEIAHTIELEQTTLKNSHINAISIFVNRVQSNIIETLPRFANIFYMREIEEIDHITLAQIKDELGAEFVYGDKKKLDTAISKPKIAAMNIENLLDRLEPNNLIITPGDRLDIILAVIQSHYSSSYPSVAGIVLTGEILPPKNFIDLLDGLRYKDIPILALAGDTYQSVLDINAITPNFRVDDKKKISLSLGEFMSSIDSRAIYDNILNYKNDILTPSMFEYSLYQRAKESRKTIILPEATDERILHACDVLLRRDVVDIILLGDESDINYLAATHRLDIAKATIINPATSHLVNQFAEQFYEMRKHKNISLDAAKEAMGSLSYFATMMIHNNLADGMVSGAVHTTQETILPALQIIKTAPNISLVSSSFFMCLEREVLVYADCAIVQDPNESELAQIAIASAITASQFDIEPRVAMLSYSTGSSGKGDDVEKVRRATAIAKEMRPDLLIEGPIQYDAAVDESVAKLKLPDSEVAGRASVLIFPDLNTGNNTYKAVQRSSGAIAIGPVLQGLNKPINDLSRGCDVADIVNTVLITAIQAQGVKE